MRQALPSVGIEIGTPSGEPDTVPANKPTGLAAVEPGSIVIEAHIDRRPSGELEWIASRGRGQIRVNIAPCGHEIALPRQVASVYGSRIRAHRVRHVCRNLYGTNTGIFASLQAFSCWRFSVDRSR
jgi:hypothetical protein